MANSEMLDSLDANSFYIEGADIADTRAPMRAHREALGGAPLQCQAG